MDYTVESRAESFIVRAIVNFMRLKTSMITITAERLEGAERVCEEKFNFSRNPEIGIVIDANAIRLETG